MCFPIHTASDGWSSTTSRRRSSLTRPIRARRVTSPAGSDECDGIRVNALLVVVAVVGWLIALLLVARLVMRDREVRAARATLGAPDDVPFDAAIEQAMENADDRVGEAEA